MSACAPDMPADFVQVRNPQAQATPTTGDSIAAPQVTGQNAPLVTPEPAFKARLTALRSGARVFDRQGAQSDIPQDESTEIKVDDGIAVITSEGQTGQGYSILDVSDDLEVELFSQTSIFFAELQEKTDGSTHTTLDIDGGHIFVHLNELTSSGVMVRTPFVSIESMAPGTDFDVCYNGEDLLCILVKKGVVEILTHNRREVLHAGEALQVSKDQPLSSPVCAPVATFSTWEEEFRQLAATPGLSQGIAALPQGPCPLTDLALPVNAQILYQDQFINPFSGWARGKIDNFIVRYAGLQYYRVQAQETKKQYLAFVPEEEQYGDVNIDLKAIAQSESAGDFRYGVTFRRSENRYYAFVISPISKTWYFLKRTAQGLEVLEKGTDDRMRGLKSREWLRVEAYGPTFLLFINGRFIYSVHDSEYASGEAGVFVETMDSPDAIVRFDSIVLWKIQTEILIPDTGTGSREYCFNTLDDDGDRLVDRNDPDCQRKDPTPTPPPVNTLRPPVTSTPQPTSTRPSSTPVPSKTKTPTKTNIPTQTTEPTLPPTFTPLPPSNTPVSPEPPEPTATTAPTNTTEPPQPSNTPEPQQPSNTPELPQPSNTPEPQQPSNTPGQSDPPPGANPPSDTPEANGLPVMPSGVTGGRRISSSDGA